MKRIILYSALITALFTSCKKDSAPEYNPSVKGSVAVEFDNVAGSSDLQLNTGTYTNAAGESFTVTKLKYYVSNFVFTNTAGTEYTVPKDSCYFLVDESVEDSHETEMRIPEGEYKTVSFWLGVDSLKCTADISQRKDVLDVTGDGADMYWTWNSGYIFFKMEGTSPAITGGMGNEFYYHIGGFGGYSSPTINNLKKITLDLTARGTAKIKASKSTDVHLLVDILKAFNGSSTVSLAANPMVMFNPFSTSVSANYTAMFAHDHTHN